jgi:hypothetical protein
MNGGYLVLAGRIRSELEEFTHLLDELGNESQS